MISFEQLLELGLIKPHLECSGGGCKRCLRGFVSDIGSLVYWCNWAHEATLNDMCAGARADGAGGHDDCGIAFLAGIEKHV